MNNREMEVNFRRDQRVSSASLLEQVDGSQGILGKGLPMSFCLKGEEGALWSQTDQLMQ
jgi:hypothetical protein